MTYNLPKECLSFDKRMPFLTSKEWYSLKNLKHRMKLP